MKERILVADDERDLARAIKMILELNNYEVNTVENGKEVLEKLNKENYDIIILDVMMPVLDGLETVKEIRKLNLKTPILLLTAKSQIDDKVEGLDAGANDYLTKPFNKKELLARIRALARIKEEKNEKYQIGNLLFNKENSEISSQNASLRLNNKECEIMEFLVKNQERSVSKNELKNRIWTKNDSDETIVTMYISYLQDKFSALGANVKIIEQNGYILEKLV